MTLPDKVTIKNSFGQFARFFKKKGKQNKKRD